MIKSSLKECKTIINDTACESTAHGIPHIFKRKNLIIKTFWILCTLAATGVCSWLVTKSVNDYLNYDTVTLTQVIDEVPTLFPVVSICNKNPFTTDSAFTYVDQFLEETFYKYALFDTDTFDMIRYILGVKIRSVNFTDDERKAFGLQIDNMLLMCSYNQKPCSSNDFYWFFDPLYG
jgi:hypothetical protein